MEYPLSFGPTLRIIEENFQVTTVHQLPNEGKVLMKTTKKVKNAEIFAH